MVKLRCAPGAAVRGCAALACAMVALLAANAIAAPKTYVVAIENMRFNPPDLTVKRGDRVVWINKDIFPHTATAETRAFDSRSIAASASWSYEPGKAGTFPYGCTFHPTMHGALTVR
ncbi:cupredoxin family copper-binding protein [Paraburkholderia strydomiana]|uniref:cupredoxin domain-containing protein n=1 Tax=Paraburkholderia strydomiana TaxID=1245417 RepID=UPI0038BD44DA